MGSIIHYWCLTLCEGCGGRIDEKSEKCEKHWERGIEGEMSRTLFGELVVEGKRKNGGGRAKGRGVNKGECGRK